MSKKTEDKKFKKFLKEIFKLRSGHYKICLTCDGTGKVLRYPYYSTIMPEKKLIPCEDCGGRGEIFVVPNDVKLIREANIK